MSLILAALLLQPIPLVFPLDPPSSIGVRPSAGPSVGEAAPGQDSAQDEVSDAVRVALKAAPRRTKVGRIRGLRAKSSVRFVAAPDDPYVMTASFGFPERCRVILSNAGGAFERYQLGATLLGRDLVKDAPQTTTRSFVLAGAGRSETLLDMELRRSLFLWPDAPKFEGKGTTYVAKVETIGILLATVDETTGLPSRIRAFGQDGKPAAEFHSLVWGAASPKDAHPRPESFTFAAGGQDLWTETVQAIDDTWRFTDVWFLPSDRLTAVMGSETAGQLRIRAVGGAWVHRVSHEARSEEGTPPTVQELADLAAAGWSDFRKTVQKSFIDGGEIFVSPHVTLILDESDVPVAWEYEALAAEDRSPKGAPWSWRSPRNYWSFPLTRESASSGAAGLHEGLEALATVAVREGDSPSRAGVRFLVGEESVNGTVRSVGVDLELISTAPPGDSTPDEDVDDERNENPAK